MRLLVSMLFCCLLLAGCRAGERHATAPTGQPAEDTTGPREDTPPAPLVQEGCFDRACEDAAIHFFTLTEQVASVAAVLVRVVSVGVYVFLFPVVGFGHGGPG
jgi:hypothetical protein